MRILRRINSLGIYYGCSYLDFIDIYLFLLFQARFRERR